MKLLKPISIKINEIQEDESRISEIPNLFISLEEHFKTESGSTLSLLSHPEAQNCLRKLEI